MLAKKYRLPVHKVYRLRGRVFGGDYFSIKITKNNLGYSRFGAVVGVKISKKATERNKLRRLVFNTIKENFEMLKKKNLDVLILTRPNIINLSKEEIKKLITNSLSQIANNYV